MSLLHHLAAGVPEEERDDWIAKLSSLESRLPEHDEFRLLLDALALHSVTVQSKLDLALENFSTRTEILSASDIKEIISMEVNIPSFQELRKFLTRVEEFTALLEEAKIKETRNIGKLEKLTKEMKTLTGKSFLIFLSSVTTGAVVGLLVPLAQPLITKYLL